VAERAPVGSLAAKPCVPDVFPTNRRRVSRARSSPCRPTTAHSLFGSHPKSAKLSSHVEKNVRSYARVLRQSDTPPDQALLLVKEAIAFEIPARNLATRRLLDDVALWCIDAYYAA
jgi:hypothetical protein